MRRREFIKAIAGSSASWPFAAGAQQLKMPVVGLLRSASFTNATRLVRGFREGLKEAGFVEGQNVTIEFSSAENQPNRLPALAADLIRQPVAAIVCNTIAARAAEAATTTIPIVFVTGGDPVRQELVASLSRTGSNVTGVVFFTGVLGSKRLDLLRQIVPKATTIGMLVSPNSPPTEEERRDVQAAAQAIGQQLIILDVRSTRDVETALQTFVQHGAGAVLVGTGVFFFPQSRANCRTGGSLCAAGNLYSARVCRSWRPDELRGQHCRRLSPSRHLRRPDS